MHISDYSMTFTFLTISPIIGTPVNISNKKNETATKMVQFVSKSKRTAWVYDIYMVHKYCLNTGNTGKTT